VALLTVPAPERIDRTVCHEAADQALRLAEEGPDGEMCQANRDPLNA
jgi:hypothetical protein